MAWCLTALSHYLNQCGILISEFCGIHLRAISQRVYKLLFIWWLWKLYLIIKLLPHLPGANVHWNMSLSHEWPSLLQTQCVKHITEHVFVFHKKHPAAIFVLDSMHQTSSRTSIVFVIYQKHPAAIFALDSMHQIASMTSIVFVLHQKIQQPSLL